jgi:hypothetical protein
MATSLEISNYYYINYDLNNLNNFNQINHKSSTIGFFLLYASIKL